MTNLSPFIYVSKLKDTLSAIDKNSPTSDGIFFSITKLASFARFLRPIYLYLFFPLFAFKGEGIKTTPLSSNLCLNCDLNEHKGSSCCRNYPVQIEQDFEEKETSS